MRLIRLGLISFLLFFLVLLGLSLLFPSHQRVSRAINIAAPREKVYAAVSDLRAWDSWNRFVSNTPLTGRSISSPSSGKGAAIRSDQLIVTILEAGQNAAGMDSVTIGWDQSHGKHFTGGFHLLQLYPDSLTVQWWFDFHFRWYPWEKFGSLVYDQKLGPVMEESLAGLKHFLENSK